MHGLPMSIKDQFAVKGYIDTAGYAAELFKPENWRTYNSPCVEVMIDANTHTRPNSSTTFDYIGQIHESNDKITGAFVSSW